MLGQIKNLLIRDISLDDLVDPLQIGWIVYMEGDAVIKVKVIRDGRNVFLSHPTAYRKGICVDVISYPDKEIWELKSKTLLSEFRRAVGSAYYYRGTGNHVNRPEQAGPQKL